MQRLRVFIASPGDVTEERDAASLVVSELHRTVGKREGVQIEPIRWETHAWPDVGSDAQDSSTERLGSMTCFAA